MENTTTGAVDVAVKVIPPVDQVLKLLPLYVSVSALYDTPSTVTMKYASMPGMVSPLTPPKISWNEMRTTSPTWMPAEAGMINCAASSTKPL
ncbi:hypothetical protein LMG5911_03297 [Achromobacter spanius]|nr:hypothetical protein LMG5911_03297 [Achromobacter spanius]